jgi:hypothetical protein
MLIQLCGLTNIIARVSGQMMTQDSCSVNGHIVLKGTFLVRCKILSAQLKVSKQKLEDFEICFIRRVHIYCTVYIYVCCIL